jgi:hypothetical protein
MEVLIIGMEDNVIKDKEIIRSFSSKKVENDRKIR